MFLDKGKWSLTTGRSGSVTRRSSSTVGSSYRHTSHIGSGGSSGTRGGRGWCRGKFTSSYSSTGDAQTW